MNHRKLPLTFFKLSDSDFQKYHQRHLSKISNTRSIENHGRLLLNQKPTPSSQQLIDFSNLVFGWAGRTGGRVRGKTDRVPHKARRYAFLTTFRHIKDDNFFLAVLELQTIKGLGARSGSVSYASKHLRFFCPERYAVLDSIIEKHLRIDLPGLSKIHLLYLYCVYCQEKAAELSKKHLLLSDCLPPSPNIPAYSNIAKPWKAADVDMAIFAKFKGW